MWRKFSESDETPTFAILLMYGAAQTHSIDRISQHGAATHSHGPTLQHSDTWQV